MKNNLSIVVYWECYEQIMLTLFVDCNNSFLKTHCISNVDVVDMQRNDTKGENNILGGGGKAEIKEGQRGHVIQAQMKVLFINFSQVCLTRYC